MTDRSESFVCVCESNSVEISISSSMDGRLLELCGKKVGYGLGEDALMGVRWHSSRKERNEGSMLLGSKL